jgi:hypothetical protein
VNAFSNSCAITALLSVLLGLFVLLKGHKRPVNVYWSLFCFSVASWSFGLGMMVHSQTFERAYFWLRWVHYAGAIMIPIFFLHFVVLYLDLKIRRFLVVGYTVAFAQQILSIGGLLASLEPLPPFTFYTVPRPAYVIFVAYFFAFVVYAHYCLLKRMKSADGSMKNQLRYIFFGTSIGFCGGTTAFLPVFHLPVFPYGVYGVFVYIFSVSYAILKHRLMDITVIIRKTLIYAAVMGALMSIYLVSIAIFARLSEGLTGAQNVFSSSIAALLITWCFQPLRKKVQAFVDGKFFRQYVDREEKLYELSREVITHTTPEAMAVTLIRVLSETLHPKGMALYLRSRDGDGFVQVGQSGATELPSRMPEHNALADYFLDHPQPFVQDLPEHMGAPQDTRSPRRQDSAT